jgi:hypothetical protein
MRMPELTQRLGLNLADPFAGHRELLADFSKRMIGARLDPCLGHARYRCGFAKLHSILFWHGDQPMLTRKFAGAARRLVFFSRRLHRRLSLAGLCRV